MEKKKKERKQRPTQSGLLPSLTLLMAAAGPLLPSEVPAPGRGARQFIPSGMLCLILSC